MTNTEIQINNLRGEIDELSERLSVMKNKLVGLSNEIEKDLQIRFKVGDYLLINGEPQIVSIFTSDGRIVYDLIGMKTGNRYFDGLESIDHLCRKLNQYNDHNPTGKKIPIQKISKEELLKIL